MAELVRQDEDISIDNLVGKMLHSFGNLGTIEGL